MRKSLALLFLLLWLPLQWTTALAAAYCSHEAGQDAPAHLGHHTHAQDHAHASVAPDEGGPHDLNRLAEHADCCHASAGHGTPSVRAFHPQPVTTACPTFLATSLADSPPDTLLRPPIFALA